VGPCDRSWHCKLPQAEGFILVIAISRLAEFSLLIEIERKFGVEFEAVNNEAFKS
jgi:hypothetical protein